MLHSMTGFARESAETTIGTLTWEIRAVNHRYLDVQFKLPEDLRPKEQTFRQQASSSLGRGKVECALYFRRAFDQIKASPARHTHTTVGARPYVSPGVNRIDDLGLLNQLFVIGYIINPGIENLMHVTVRVRPNQYSGSAVAE